MWTGSIWKTELLKKPCSEGNHVVSQSEFSTEWMLHFQISPAKCRQKSFDAFSEWTGPKIPQQLTVESVWLRTPSRCGHLYITDSSRARREMTRIYISTSYGHFQNSDTQLLLFVEVELCCETEVV